MDRGDREDHTHIVIMAGGRGTRFWPRSRMRTPKQLLNIVGEGTMLRQTFDRIRPLAAPSRIWIVTNEEYRTVTAEQIPELPQGHIIAEPLVRSTAPCIGLAALHIRREEEDAVMAVLPADHFIPDEEAFRACLTVGVETARRKPALLTIGIRPTSPETGYGYIELGDLFLEAGDHPVYRAARFTEKPDRDTAESFLTDGCHLWNSGIFVWRVSTILDAFARYCPALHRGLSDIGASLGTAEEEARVRRAYAAFPAISIDYAVMEKAERVFVVAGGFGWSDVGSWSAVQSFWEKDGDGNAVRGRVISIDTTGSIVESRDKLVALVGMEDVIVIESPDALLVCRKDRDQDIRKVIGQLERRGLTEYL